MKKEMKKATWKKGMVLAAAASLTLGWGLTAQAEEYPGFEDFTVAADEDGNMIYEFPEVKVTVPADWEGQCGVDAGDEVTFYHMDSAKSYGGAYGGELFYLCYSQDYSFLESEDLICDVIGSGEKGVYYVRYPSDFRGYEGDESIRQEYIDMYEETDWVVDRMEVTDPGEGVADTDKISEDGDYLLVESSGRALTEADLEGMNADEMQMAINEIYARHGRKFATKSIQDYFNSKSWYKGTVEPTKFEESSLNVVESGNIALILRCMGKVGSDGVFSGGTEKGGAASSGIKKASSTVNIRSTSSTSGAVLGVVPQGDTVNVTGSSSNGWVPVEYRGIKGYVKEEYLEESAGTAQSAGESQEEAAVVYPELTGEVIAMYDGEGNSISVYRSVDGNCYDDDWNKYVCIGQYDWVCEPDGSNWTTLMPEMDTIRQEAAAELTLVDEDGNNYVTIYRNPETGAWENIAGGVWTEAGNGVWTAMDGGTWYTAQ